MLVGRTLYSVSLGRARRSLEALPRRAGALRAVSRGWRGPVEGQAGMRHARMPMSRVPSHVSRRGGAPCASVAAVIASPRKEGRQATKVGLLGTGERLERLIDLER